MGEFVTLAIMKDHADLTRHELVALVIELEAKAAANAVEQNRHSEALRDSEARLRSRESSPLMTTA